MQCFFRCFHHTSTTLYSRLFGKILQTSRCDGGAAGEPHSELSRLPIGRCFHNTPTNHVEDLHKNVWSMMERADEPALYPRRAMNVVRFRPREWEQCPHAAPRDPSNCEGLIFTDVPTNCWVSNRTPQTNRLSVNPRMVEVSWSRRRAS